MDSPKEVIHIWFEIKCEEGIACGIVACYPYPHADHNAIAASNLKAMGLHPIQPIIGGSQLSSVDKVGIVHYVVQP